jgi:branched-chain amino acid transport system substrate-binding protein
MRIRFLTFFCILTYALTLTAQDFKLVRIAVPVPLTGSLSNLGKDNLNGAFLAAEVLNTQDFRIDGRNTKFEIVAYDDAANPKASELVAQEIIQTNIQGVIGHLSSSASISASRIYSEAGLPHISPSASNPKLTRQGYKTAFRLVADDTQLPFVLGKFAATSLKGKSIAVLDDLTPYGRTLTANFIKGVEESSGYIVAPAKPSQPA